MVLPSLSSKSIDESLSFRNFQQLPLPIQTSWSSRPSTFRSSLLPAFSFASIYSNSPRPRPPAIRNVSHPLILLASLPSGLCSNLFPLSQMPTDILPLFTAQIKYYFLLMFNLGFPWFCPSTKPGGCNNKVKTLPFEYQFPVTKRLHPCYKSSHP